MSKGSTASGGEPRVQIPGGEPLVQIGGAADAAGAAGDCHEEWKKGAAASERSALDLASVRERLRNAKGPQFWRSLEELAATPQFEDMLHREFPRHAAEWPADGDGATNGFSRRNFLQLSSASLALAGLTACTRQPIEKIVPYVKQPEEILPGRPLFFATAMPFLGYANPVLAESNMGRPTKLEGNPEHGASLGATDAFTQAAILTLYDPDRSQSISNLENVRTWSALQAALKPFLDAQIAIEGVGIRVLTGSTTSATFRAQWDQLMGPYPQAQWHQWEPAGRDAVRAGSKLAFGEYLETRYDFAKADVVLTLDSDVLTAGPGAVRYARDFASRRKVSTANAPQMNRLYTLETTPTATGSMADHRMALPPRGIAGAALALAAALGVEGASAPEQDAELQRFVKAAARDLMAHRGRCVVVPGEYTPAAVHALAHAMNAALGNGGETVIYGDAVEVQPQDQLASLKSLRDDLVGGKVEVLFVLGANPVFDAPADLDFANAIKKAKIRIHHGLYQDETAEYCQWHLPEAHFLEAWGDARAYDGTASILQPLIEPLYEGKSQIEVLALLNGKADAKGHDLVQATWKGNGLTDATWRKALHDGFVEGTASPARSVTAQGAGIAQAIGDLLAASTPSRAGFVVVLRPDAAVFDGRFANNAWLQELPRPLTKLTWDNALLISPRTAEVMHLRQRELVELKLVSGRPVRVPVFVDPGHADECATLHMGYGRTRAGRVGTGVGSAAAALSDSTSPWLAQVDLALTGETYLLATTQEHYNIEAHSLGANLEGREAIEERHLLRVMTLGEFTQEPEKIREMVESPKPEDSINPPWTYEGYAWGLAVDLNACTGCNACVIACQSENNIPVVGKEQVDKGREMHWIRIDRYYGGDLDRPEIYHQPVMCMHCEQAPCEVVCPVGATSHSAEGLNDMVYNRCVGTRYCSNNCPYKVRRFNFFAWNKIEPNDAYSHPVQKLGRNPDVTVRFRGVMEKCTYCVQRINRVKISAEIADRKVRDGEIKTACQQACPTQAIVFGNINDPESEVAKWKAGPRNYGMLEDLNTRPRTSYLARLRNPNPELGEKA
ncbi:MAG: TAT-variant-translocated molybdopterin oxidoreductase [Acidobacteriota bacterium]